MVVAEEKANGVLIRKVQSENHLREMLTFEGIKHMQHCINNY